jgi:hypothetical protein
MFAAVIVDDGAGMSVQSMWMTRSGEVSSTGVAVPITGRRK